MLNYLEELTGIICYYCVSQVLASRLGSRDGNTSHFGLSRIRKDLISSHRACIAGLVTGLRSCSNFLLVRDRKQFCSVREEVFAELRDDDRRLLIPIELFRLPRGHASCLIFLIRQSFVAQLHLRGRLLAIDVPGLRVPKIEVTGPAATILSPIERPLPRYLRLLQLLLL